MSKAKQLSDLTTGSISHPKGKGKRSYQKALRQAAKNGCAQYKGKQLTLAELGGTPAQTQPVLRRQGKKLLSFQERQGDPNFLLGMQDH